MIPLHYGAFALMPKEQQVGNMASIFFYRFNQDLGEFSKDSAEFVPGTVHTPLGRGWQWWGSISVGLEEIALPGEWVVPGGTGLVASSLHPRGQPWAS